MSHSYKLTREYTSIFASQLVDFLNELPPPLGVGAEGSYYDCQILAKKVRVVFRPYLTLMNMSRVTSPYLAQNIVAIKVPAVVRSRLAQNHKCTRWLHHHACIDLSIPECTIGATPGRSVSRPINARIAKDRRRQFQFHRIVSNSTDSRTIVQSTDHEQETLPMVEAGCFFLLGECANHHTDIFICNLASHV